MSSLSGDMIFVPKKNQERGKTSEATACDFLPLFMFPGPRVRLPGHEGRSHPRLSLTPDLQPIAVHLLDLQGEAHALRSPGGREG